MKRPNNYTIFGFLFLVLCQPVLLRAQAGPGGTPLSGIPQSALPLSAQGGGLIPTPNPIDRTSNLTVTGNIRGGRYFRDSVPYSDSTSFVGTLPSSSLDSFVRDSAGSEDITAFSSRYKPYYSQTQTVTKIRSGSSTVTRPPTMNIGGYVPITPVFGTSTSKTETSIDTGLIMPRTSSLPMSMTIKELEEQISSEIDEYSPTPKPTYTQYQIQTEEKGYKITDRVSEKTRELQESLTAKKHPFLPPLQRKSPDETTQKAETAPQKDLPDEEYEESPESANLWTPREKPQQEQSEGYEQVKKQIEELRKKIDAVLTEQQDDKTEYKEQYEENYGEPYEEPAEAELGSLSRIPEAPIGQSYEIPQDKLYMRNSYAPKTAEIDPSISAKAKKILGPSHTHASFAENNYHKNMVAAEYYLKQGRYYRAVDAYTLALIYKPDDPLSYTRKSCALFASGEYMSSALFLSRTLSKFPEYAKLKIKIDDFVGGSENLQARLADAKEWLANSDAPELHFLIAYVYYQTNEIGLAKEAIEAAYEKSPDTPAVQNLKKAIEDSI